MMYSIVYSDSEENTIKEVFCPNLAISIEVADYIYSKGEMASIFNTESDFGQPLVTIS